MPEGDSLHRVARRLQVLVGERVEAESPNPRGLATGVARAVDGRVLERVDAVGKNVLLHFEGGVVVRSHLRMNGRWRVRRRGDPGWRGSPWLVLRGAEWEATQWNGPVLELGASTPSAALGPDLLAPGTDPAEIVARLRRVDQTRLVGEALVDQRLVAGIGNMWLAEALWHGASLAVVAARRASVDDGPAADARRGRETRCAHPSTADVLRVPSTAEPDVAVRAAASRFAHVGSATRTGRRTGARRASRLRDGEGGIRTLDERITTRNALAGRRLQPLGHLSRGRSGYRTLWPGPEARLRGRGYPMPPTEGCRSGRTGRSRKPLGVQASREFKSLPLRIISMSCAVARRPRGSRRAIRPPGSRGSRRSTEPCRRTLRSFRRTMRTATSAQTKRKTASVTAANPVPNVYARSTREA